MHEFRDKANTPHDYKITEVKLIVSGSSTSNARTSLTSIDGAKLLENVEKSYDPGVKLLDASEKTPTLFSRVYHGSGAKFDNIHKISQTLAP